jgi:spermidine synthase
VKSKVKQVLSYVAGTIVEKRPSRISGELEVWYQSGKYVLHSPDANYSFDTLHRIFQKAFKKLSITKRNPKQVLILGFGAGSVAHILRKELLLNASITGVEADPEVIALARKYFELDAIDNLTIQLADAAQFASTCTATFDLVISDVFVDKEIPEEVLSQAYASDLVRLTRASSIGMMNMIIETSEQRNNLKRMMNYLQQAGASVEPLRITSINTLLVWHTNT